MANTNFQIGQVVNYTNGGPSTYTGQIVKIKEKTLIVIDDEDGMKLWKSGFAVGDEIGFTQIKP